METMFFILVAAVAILSSILVVAMRNPINSALSLIMTFFCLATLYVMLDAPFMAAIQVIVYAGAIMVLIVFVIMLLNIRTETSKNYVHGLFAGSITAVLTLFVICSFLKKSPLTGALGNMSPEMVTRAGNTELIGAAMFSDFLLPFEITSILLLVAIVGSVILAKRKL
jgi:NADH-quinone oxidoreductase subunit J